MAAGWILHHLSRTTIPANTLKLRAGFSTTKYMKQETKKYVLGCGSNVVDHIYNVKVVPSAGEKGFFLSPFKALEKKLIGGVTLNHLCWAALGGVSTGLLALQGNDEQGHFIRTDLKKMGVATQFIKVHDHFSTAQCHVFIQEDGERCIFMAPAASSLINKEAAKEHFANAIQHHASMVTSEISQVPFTGVLEVLTMGREAGVMTILDLDIPPSVAINEAKLGKMEDFMKCLKMADILKPAKAAAEEVVKELGCEINGSLRDMASILVEKIGSKMVAITDGTNGSIIATSSQLVIVEAPQVSRVIDTTGAGDAFLGGLIVGLNSMGIPESEGDLKTLGRIANTFGATCVQSVGGVPVSSSRVTLQSYLPHMTPGSQDVSTEEGLVLFAKSLQRDSSSASSLVACSQQCKEGWSNVLDVLEQCQGQVFTSGIGKSGIVAERLAASLSSIGVSSEFVNAAEWSHGDLGKLHPGKDVCIFLSHSGNTSECVSAASHIASRGITTVAITSDPGSGLSKLSTAIMEYSHVRVDEPFGCLPSTSLIIQEMLCNGIVNELIGRRAVDSSIFKYNHPGGSIGVKQHGKKDFVTYIRNELSE